MQGLHCIATFDCEARTGTYRIRKFARSPRSTGLVPMSSSLSLRPYRITLGWQGAATLVIAAVAGALAGGQAALSALLGGVVSLTAGVVYAFVAWATPQRDPATTIAGLFRAEAAKVVMIVVQLWLLLSFYREVVLPALLAAFIATILLSGVAVLVRN